MRSPSVRSACRCLEGLDRGRVLGFDLQHLAVGGDRRLGVLHLLQRTRATMIQSSRDSVESSEVFAAHSKSSASFGHQSSTAASPSSFSRASAHVRSVRRARP